MGDIPRGAPFSGPLTGPAPVVAALWHYYDGSNEFEGEPA